MSPGMGRGGMDASKLRDLAENVTAQEGRMLRLEAMLALVASGGAQVSNISSAGLGGSAGSATYSKGLHPLPQTGPPQSMPAPTTTSGMHMIVSNGQSVFDRIDSLEREVQNISYSVLGRTKPTYARRTPGRTANFLQTTPVCI